ncbi:MAG: hypothetical protein GY948_19115 [Alphaproteobacteria bacterium]|nr:hypothetical protein [Alphaproteobacteria bacterium]
MLLSKHFKIHPIAIALALRACLLTWSAYAQPANIGDVLKIKNSVSGSFGTQTKKVKPGDTVFRDQRISTKRDSSGQFQFLDKTYLAVGPNASIVLDKFVYAGTPPEGEVAISLTKGAFRFLTGDLPSRSYKISTPTSVIGVRGTMFDVFVGARGQTIVVLFDGAVEFCDLAGNCLDLTDRCQAAGIGADGALTNAARLNQALLGESEALQVAPFLLDQAEIVPQARLAQSVITDCLSEIDVASNGGNSNPPIRSKQPRKPKFTPPPRCSKGQVRKAGKCVRVKRRCRAGTKRKGKRCIAIVKRCPRGTVRKGKRCLRVRRPCPRGKVRKGKRCVRVIKRCPRGTVRRGKRCVRIKIRCPFGTIPAGNTCIRIRIPIPGGGSHSRPSRPNID